MHSVRAFAALAALFALTGCLAAYPAGFSIPAFGALTRMDELCQILHPPTPTSSSMFQRCQYELRRTLFGDEPERQATEHMLKDWAIARERYRYDPNRYYPCLPVQARVLNYFVGGRMVTCRTVGPDIECG